MSLGPFVLLFGWSLEAQKRCVFVVHVENPNSQILAKKKKACTPFCCAFSSRKFKSIALFVNTYGIKAPHEWIYKIHIRWCSHHAFRTFEQIFLYSKCSSRKVKTIQLWWFQAQKVIQICGTCVECWCNCCLGKLILHDLAIGNRRRIS